MKSQIFMFLLGNPGYFFHDPGLVLVKICTFLAKMSLKMLVKIFSLEISVSTIFSDDLAEGHFKFMSHFK